MAKIESLERLRELYKLPAGRTLEKQLDHVEKHGRRFIALSPFLLIATRGADGLVDVSPRGEDPGFVQVLDDRTLAIPDRPGNNRLDSLTNILSDPAAGLIFLIPGVQETFRVNGMAEVRDDADLLRGFEVRGKLPATVVLIRVREAYLHCAKSILRSRLWQEDAKIDRGLLPSMGQMIKDQVQSDGPVESQEDMLRRYQQVLY